MAEEISLSMSMTLENGTLKESFLPGTVLIDQAVIGAHSPVVLVSTSEEDLDTGDISTLGRIAGVNLDTTNYVVVGPSTGGPLHPLMRLPPGEPFALRLEPGITWRWVANTSPCKVQIKLLEN